MHDLREYLFYIARPGYIRRLIILSQVGFLNMPYTLRLFTGMGPSPVRQIKDQTDKMEYM